MDPYTKLALSGANKKTEDEVFNLRFNNMFEKIMFFRKGILASLVVIVIFILFFEPIARIVISGSLASGNEKLSDLSVLQYFLFSTAIFLPNLIVLFLIRSKMIFFENYLVSPRPYYARFTSPLYVINYSDIVSAESDPNKNILYLKCSDADYKISSISNEEFIKIKTVLNK